MSPEELPQQRVYEVVDLPPTPAGLETKLDWVEPFPDDRPKTTPRKVQFLCAVEWAWSPMHNRIDNYYLHQRGKRWLLFWRQTAANWAAVLITSTRAHRTLVCTWPQHGA